MKEEALSHDEIQLFSRRDLIIRSVIGVPFAGIAWRLWDLHINDGKKYADLSKGNRIRLKSEPAPRGIIYDRHSVILAKNIPAYILMLVREDVTDIPKVLKKISVTLQVPLEKLERALQSQRNVAKFNRIRIYEDLTWRQIALIGSYQEEFPGISIGVLARRYYPLLNTGAHVCGYMNQITKPQLKKLPKNKVKSAKMYGQEGIEAIYNHQLIGTDGGRQVEVNNTGREIRDFPNSIEPIPGNDIVLCMNSRLQRAVENIMQDRKGSVVIMNPHNGEVLSMVSLPAFDPNEFSQGLSIRRWNQLRNHPDHVLNNKCIKSMYSPGSTFKMAVAAAALEMGVVDLETEHLCEGHWSIGRRIKYCGKRSGHGSINVLEALEYSCNVFFYKISLQIGVDKIWEYAGKFGLGRVTGIDLLNESRGLIPNRAWKLKRTGKEWIKGETPNIAIGQGSVMTTPIQLVNYTSVIANGGYLIRPKMAKGILLNSDNEGADGSSGNQRFENVEPSREIIDISPKTLGVLKLGMERNVNGKKGTGRRGKSSIVRIAGKTGTTQVISYKTRDRLKRETGTIDEKYFNHAWFVAFAPVEKPMISAVVMLENGKSGSNAARVMKRIMEYYFTEIEEPPAPELNLDATADTKIEV